MTTQNHIVTNNLTSSTPPFFLPDLQKKFQNHKTRPHKSPRTSQRKMPRIRNKASFDRPQQTRSKTRSRSSWAPDRRRNRETTGWRLQRPPNNQVAASKLGANSSCLSRLRSKSRTQQTKGWTRMDRSSDMGEKSFTYKILEVFSEEANKVNYYENNWQGTFRLLFRKSHPQQPCQSASRTV